MVSDCVGSGSCPSHLLYFDLSFSLLKSKCEMKTTNKKKKKKKTDSMHCFEDSTSTCIKAPDKKGY